MYRLGGYDSPCFPWLSLYGMPLQCSRASSGMHTGAVMEITLKAVTASPEPVGREMTKHAWKVCFVELSRDGGSLIYGGRKFRRMRLFQPMLLQRATNRLLFA